MNNRMPFFAVLSAAAVLSSCAGTRIARINADPTRFANRNVSVTGRVTNAVGLLGTGGYQIDDGSGRIYVISTTGVPSAGSRVTVTGRVLSGANVMGHTMGTAIREQRHKVRW
jgi:hypothetical protein